MNIQLPDPKSYGGAVLNGWTVEAENGAETMSGAIVVKAAYDIAGAPNTTGSMVRSTDGNRFAIVFEDVGIKTINTKNTSDPADDVVTAFAYERDSDIALQKARVDIAVAGWGGNGAAVSGQVRVDGTIWHSRASNAHEADNDHGSKDIKANLFGWHSRGEEGRKLDVATTFLPTFPTKPTDTPDTLPPKYVPVFNNFFRRNAGSFSSIPAAQAQALPSGKTVRITQTLNGSDTVLAFDLPDLAMKARLRAWCGDCPDKPERWCIKGTISLTPDTLIVDPVARQADILWRGRFGWNGPDGNPVAWRLAQVMEGAV